MFVWSFATVTSGLQQHQPDMYSACQRWLGAAAKGSSTLARTLAPTLASLMLLAASGASAAGSGRIDVTVTGVSSASGMVGCALFSSKTGFPLESKKHAATTVRVQAASGVANCSFENVSPGEYAVAVVHDTNGNEQADTNMLGMPTEGVGVSNNLMPKLSPPSFEVSRFVVAAGQPTKLAITMKY
jgi:uncharacterized protein (DUF2141 family)